MSALQPVPNTPLRDDPQQDAIWKRWLSQLQSNVSSIGGFPVGSVPFANSAGVLTSDSGFTFSTTGDVLTVGAINVAGTTAPAAGWYLPSADLIRTPNSVTVDDNLVVSGTASVTGNTTLTGDLAVNGGDLTTSAATFNLLNATVTTLNVGGAATSLRLGAASGKYSFSGATLGYAKLSLQGTMLSDGSSTVAEGMRFDAALTGAAGDTSWLVQADIAGSIITQGNTDTIGIVATLRLAEPVITVGAGDVITVASTLYVANAPTEGATNDAIHVAAGTSRFLGNVITNTILSVSTTATVFNTVATTVNAFGAATTLTLGAATGTATIGNATLTLTNATAVNVNGASPTFASSSTGTLTLFNTNLLTVNAFGAATTLSIGASTGTTTINNDLSVGDQIASVGGVTTAGNFGVPLLVAYGRSTAQTAAVASVATFTVGASDGTFEISANILITTSTSFNFNLYCSYTDENNTAQAYPLQFATTAFTPNMTNLLGAIPYMGAVLTIRAKAATAITLYTTGTFTNVTYNVEGIIKQVN